MGVGDDGSTGLYVHVARLPGLDACDVKLAVMIGDQVGSFTQHRPWSDELSVEDFSFDIVEPWVRWHVSARGTGLVGPAGSLLTTGPGDVPMAAEFTFEAKVPPVILSEGFAALEKAGAGSSGDHYIQGGRWSGSVQLGDRQVDMAGWAIRDHTWGERNLPTMDRCWWTPMVFDDGTYELAGIDMYTTDGARTTFSYRRDAAGQVAFPYLEVEVVEGPLEDYTKTVIRCGDDVRVEAERIIHMPIAYYRGGGVGWVSDDALCRLRTADGREGFGIIELNRAMTAEEISRVPDEARA